MPNPTVSIAAFGESTLLGYGNGNPFDNPFRIPERVAEHFGRGPTSTITRVDNRAIAGRNLAEQQAAELTDRDGTHFYKPGSLSDQGIADTRGSIVILNLGINDAIDGQSVASFKEAIKQLVKRFWWTGRAVIIQTPNKIAASASYRIAPTDSAGITAAQRVDALAQALRESAAEFNLILADANSLPVALGDEFHPTNAGYQLMASDVINQINARDGGTWLARQNFRYQVALVYTSVLLRLPEAAGFEGWVNLLAAGTVNFANGTLVQSFLNSPEAQAIYPSGLSAPEFIARVYQNVFDRVANQGEIDFWAGQLSSRTRGEVLSDMLFGGANYLETSDGSIPDGVRSQKIIQNRAYMGLAYAGIFNGSSTTQSFAPGGVYAHIKDDALVVLNEFKNRFP